MFLRCLLGREDTHSIVEKVIEELLPQPELEVILKVVCVIIQSLLPEEVERGMVLDCIVCRGKEGAPVQLVECRDELRTLEKLYERLVVRVLVQRIKEGERLRRRSELMQRELSRRDEGQNGEEAYGYARPRPHGRRRAGQESVKQSSTVASNI